VMKFLGECCFPQTRLELVTNTKTPIVAFEKLEPADLASALGSLNGLHGRVTTVQPKLGGGYERFLGWALREIADAKNAGSGNDCERTSVNAVMHARRSLSCLADQYLQRDGFLFCRRPPREADQKADILVRRGVFDELETESLSRAINERHTVEHEYKTISLSKAQDAVQMVRATVQNSVARSSPYNSPALFGTISGGSSISGGNVKGWFHGWSGSAFLLVTTVQSPWAGIIVPTNETEAVARRVYLEHLLPEQLLEALSIAESLLRDEGSLDCTPNLWHARLHSAGLLA